MKYFFYLKSIIKIDNNRFNKHIHIIAIDIFITWHFHYLISTKKNAIQHYCYAYGYLALLNCLVNTKIQSMYRSTYEEAISCTFYGKNVWHAVTLLREHQDIVDVTFPMSMSLQSLYVFIIPINYYLKSNL